MNGTFFIREGSNAKVEDETLSGIPGRNPADFEVLAVAFVLDFHEPPSQPAFELQLAAALDQPAIARPPSSPAVDLFGEDLKGNVRGQSHDGGRAHAIGIHLSSSLFPSFRIGLSRFLDVLGKGLELVFPECFDLFQPLLKLVESFWTQLVDSNSGVVLYAFIS